MTALIQRTLNEKACRFQQAQSLQKSF